MGYEKFEIVRAAMSISCLLEAEVGSLLPLLLVPALLPFALENFIPSKATSIKYINLNGPHTMNPF